MSDNTTPHKVPYVKNIKEFTDKKGNTIVLPEFDYVTATKSHTKRYRNCLYILMGIDGCPRKLIDYLVDNMSENNIVGNNSMTRGGFIDACVKAGIPTYTQNTVKEAFKELTNVGFLLALQRGFYAVNPLYFFCGEENDRVKMIKLTLEFAAGTTTAMTINKTKK